MGRVEPIKPVHPVSYTKDSTYKQKSQRGGTYTGQSFREEIRKAAMKKDQKDKNGQTTKASRTDTVTISEKSRRKYEKMREQKEDGISR